MNEIQVVQKSWGRELVIVNSKAAGYCGKIMQAEPPGTSRIERHGKKDETFYVLEGSLMLEVFGYGEIPVLENILYLRPGDSYRLTPGHWHRFSAGEKGTRFVEFSTFHEDADTERANT